MQITQTFSRTAPVIRNRSALDVAAGIGVTVVPTTTYVSSGGNSSVNVFDATYIRYTGATYDVAGRIVISGIAEAVTFESLTPEIGTVDQSGFVARVSDGLCRIKFTIGSFVGEKQVSCSRITPGTLDVFSTWAASSFGGRCTAYAQAKLDGASAVTGKAIFTNQNHEAAIYVRNGSCWIQDFVQACTCMSPWNSTGGINMAGTAITTQHVLLAAHYQYGIGTRVRFVTAGNVVVERTVVGSVTHPSYIPNFPDLALCTLDSALPGTITPCKVLPSNWAAKLISIQNGRIPCLLLDQEEKALTGDLFGLSSRTASFQHPIDATRLTFFESIISGDSGNPSFLVTDTGDLILLTLWTSGGAGSGTFVTPQISALNAMIATADAQAGLSTGLTVQTADLSGYPSYV
jgi:hypothetical protein